MEELDNLIISSFDFEARKGCFKKELAEILNIPINCIGSINVGSVKADGLITRLLYVELTDALIPKSRLMGVPFDYIEGGNLVFEVGDTIL